MLSPLLVTLLNKMPYASKVISTPILDIWDYLQETTFFMQSSKRKTKFFFVFLFTHKEEIKMQEF